MGHRVMLILYVAEQRRSSEFYRRVLDQDARLDVPGMTEFVVGEDVLLGLMPEAGIKRLLGDAMPDPASASGTPRAELYLRVAGAAVYHKRALAAGARQLSGMAMRDWGEVVAYSMDPDGHVLAFAEQF
tara:strand:- start:177 stop:563 length:387 start_codon:yes stop_codon:yes gene_type:complete